MELAAHHAVIENGLLLSRERESIATKAQTRRIAATGHLVTSEAPMSLCGPPSGLWRLKPVRAQQLLAISWAFSPMPFAGVWRVTEWPLGRPLPYLRERAQTSPWSP
jgi:hypothetical protein